MPYIYTEEAEQSSRAKTVIPWKRPKTPGVVCDAVGETLKLITALGIFGLMAVRPWQSRVAPPTHPSHASTNRAG